MVTLEDYRGIVPLQVLGDIHRKARKLYGKHIVNVNSTYSGGGVAELLQGLVPLYNDIGVDCGWRVLPGTYDFFTVTKKMHNALQGADINWTPEKENLYIQTNVAFSQWAHLQNHDAVIVHDPQPLPMIRFAKKRQPWIWRCHIDLSHPNQQLWDFMVDFILRYDMMVVSNEAYLRHDLPVPQVIVQPAIDPLSVKNCDLGQDDIEKYLDKFGIPRDKPLITQISRFDPWKDMEGVLRAFELVKEQCPDCRLVLCGSMAADDPEGQVVFQRVQERAQPLVESGDVFLITVESNILVNALQRASYVVLQKSLREGFGLTVSEAMWKGTPVIGSNVGGIPNQIVDGVTGYLIEPDDIQGAAERIAILLSNKERRDEMGRAAKEHVRENFLTTRLLSHWLDLIGQIVEG